MKSNQSIKLHLRRGDKVQVISGKHKNSVGIILRIDKTKMFVFVEGINLQKKHMKPTKSNQAGGIIEKEGPIHYSNVLLYCPASSKGERIKILEGVGGNKKRRMFLKSGTFAE